MFAGMPAVIGYCRRLTAVFRAYVLTSRDQATSSQAIAHSTA